ncbi:MAG: hypothetical protein V3V19_02035 [Cocleimonas sp.]
MPMFNNIMLVCIGNICRSPIAEVMLKDQHPQLTVFSSGLGALAGKPADPFSVELMTEKGIDLTNHCAQQINTVLVSSSDLILTMEQRHVDKLHSQYPESRGKVHLIGKWIDNKEIPDPYKKDKKAFIHAMTLIEAGLDAWKNKL